MVCHQKLCWQFTKHRSLYFDNFSFFFFCRFLLSFSTRTLTFTRTHTYQLTSAREAIHSLHAQAHSTLAHTLTYATDNMWLKWSWFARNWVTNGFVYEKPKRSNRAGRSLQSCRLLHRRCRNELHFVNVFTFDIRNTIGGWSVTKFLLVDGGDATTLNWLIAWDSIGVNGSPSLLNCVWCIGDVSKSQCADGTGRGSGVATAIAARVGDGLRLLSSE